MGFVDWLRNKETQPKAKKRRIARQEPVVSSQKPVTHKFTPEQEKAFKEKLALQMARTDAAIKDRERNKAKLRETEKAKLCETVGKAISGAEARKEKRVAFIKGRIAEAGARKPPQSDGDALVNAIKQVKEKTQVQVYGEVERTQVSEARRIPVPKDLADRLKRVRDSESGWGGLEDLELPKEELEGGSAYELELTEEEKKFLGSAEGGLKEEEKEFLAMKKRQKAAH
jgi:hypothetical protein